MASSDEKACEDSGRVAMRTVRTRTGVSGATCVMDSQRSWSPSFRIRAKNGRKASERS